MDLSVLPPFPLSPMDDGKTAARVPRAVSRVLWENRFYILRPFNGLLFFREESRNEAEWTFAISKPLPQQDIWSVADLFGFWHRHFHTKNYARYLVHNQINLERDITLFFVEGGTGFLREPWNRDDYPFNWRFNDGLQEGVLTAELEKFESIAGRIGGALYQTLDDWDSIPDESPLYSHEETHFICGSQEELKQVCRWICYSDNDFKTNAEGIDLTISTENIYARAQVTEVHVGDFDWFRSDTPSPWHKSDHPVLSTSIQRLFEIALEYNTPAGLDWAYRDMGSGRANSHPCGQNVEFWFAPPIDHERLEAKLQLREWLRDKVSSDELAQLLPE